MKTEQKLKSALTRLILDQPFFGSLALRLRMVADPSIGTAGTDGQTLAYAPDFVDDLSIEQLTGLIAHEVLHVANGHPWRREGRDMDTWNKACDYAINGILKNAGFYLPEDGFIDSRFAGQSAEAIYAAIKQEKQSQDDQNGQGQSNGQPDANSGHDWGQVLDNCAHDSAQQQAENQIAVLQAAQAAKAQGALPDGLARLIDSIKKPAIDWKAALRRFVQQSAKADYTWKTPSARYLASGLYLPSLQSEQMPHFVVAVDTSGSITADELNAFAAEIQAIMDECQPESLTVIYCDASVNGVEEFQQGEEIKLQPLGGGGTRFEPVFEEIKARAIEPACLVYLTDMWGSFPAVGPHYPVLWVNTGRSEMKAPFGEVLDFPRP